MSTMKIGEKTTSGTTRMSIDTLACFYSQSEALWSHGCVVPVRPNPTPPQRQTMAKYF